MLVNLAIFVFSAYIVYSLLNKKKQESKFREEFCAMAFKLDNLKHELSFDIETSHRDLKVEILRVQADYCRALEKSKKGSNRKPRDAEYRKKIGEGVKRAKLEKKRKQFEDAVKLEAEEMNLQPLVELGSIQKALS